MWGGGGLDIQSMCRWIGGRVGETIEIWLWWWWLSESNRNVQKQKREEEKMFFVVDKLHNNFQGVIITPLEK